jgi:hypothetical protein
MFALVTVAACHHDVTTPAVPLTLDLNAQRLDGAPLPVSVEERPGATDAIRDFTLTLSPDGFWQLHGHYEPAGASQSTSFPEFWDNGDYSFDGVTLTLHSNFTHAAWPAVLRGDTIAATAILPIADAPHQVVLWP